MKRILLFIVALFTILSINAQEVEHLTFMNIPIDGKISDFHKELKKKDFKRVEQSSGYYMYDGIFIGEEVKLFVYYDEKSDLVYRVCVIFLCATSQIADSKYDYLKRRLADKYETIKYDAYSNYYEQNGKKFEEDIKSGVLNRLNNLSIREIDGKETMEIFVTKPIAHRIFQEDDTINFNYAYFLSVGNVGTIVLKSSELSVKEYLGKDYFVLLSYQDSQNYEVIKRKEEEEL